MNTNDEILMNKQWKEDQEELNKYCDDPETPPWEWQLHDIAINKLRIESGQVPLFLESLSEVDWVESTNKEGDADSRFYPLAGEWVVWRLIKIMDYGFHGLLHYGNRNYGVDYFIPAGKNATQRKTATGPSVIQAIIKAIKGAKGK